MRERAAIDPATRVPRAQHAERDADHDREQHCRARELERLRKALGDVARDRAAGDERASEIAAQHAAGVVRELARQRFVEMELVRRRAIVAESARSPTISEHRIAGRDVEQQERDDDDAGERRDREKARRSERRIAPMLSAP